ncbi:hypothetical protein SPRG_22189 [Saprolegnia parasitica CBS 223.65]|uniref:Uncharacterized protein n=1 Tax=Saprolegnia parasitica (strain CBS 223.65) TaxID=695850 RepID=A0A067CBA7_SAPPC|nr:hypothetical protein SPRG_22189 [Saprolegnia parasitica CBS 223.65]KDO28054.1 hypothetical protein SPRG_22189 [Saprolegnia parasitica CBS 223.65]|eukprot:XP_012201279.1 hypothetical protein SPRG_22189 [Saprolegnia parasitica CBS 223.65]
MKPTDDMPIPNTSGQAASTGPLSSGSPGSDGDSGQSRKTSIDEEGSYNSLADATSGHRENYSDDDTEGARVVCDDGNGIKTLLRSILDSVVTHGTFATGDQLPNGFPPSLLRVDGVGRIAFPLCPEQAATLKAACTISPFGRGHDTVIDTNVRRSVEATADKVHLSPAWTAAVNQLAIDACEKLGLSFPVDAHLYKLLLYEEGDFFLEHQDTEKEPGMFGTLLVQLPAEHTGGHLDVLHRGQTKRFGLDGPASADALHYCAFFADVHHAVAPLTSGHRLVLTYCSIGTSRFSAGWRSN